VFHGESTPSTVGNAGMKDWKRIAIPLACAAAVPAAAMAAETIVYSYDARGRLVRVERTDSNASSNVITDYTFDKADNRVAKTTAGSPNPPPP
jgi:hypothetical protein